MIKRLFSSALPRSSNPIIIRLLEDASIRSKMARGTLTYPRRRLVFDIPGTVHSIFKDPSINAVDFGAFAWVPPSIYSVLLIMRLDIFNPVYHAALVALAGASYYFRRSQTSSQRRRVYHLLISRDFEHLYFGMKSGREGVEVFGALHGLDYQKVPLDRVLFFGYKQIFDCVKRGMSLKDAERYVADKYLKAPETQVSHLVKRVTKSRELQLTVVYYDSRQNEYLEAELDLNTNSLESFSDYVECLRDKNKMKFFSS